jgi:hypothetical protein
MADIIWQYSVSFSTELFIVESRDTWGHISHRLTSARNNPHAPASLISERIRTDSKEAKNAPAYTDSSR